MREGAGFVRERRYRCCDVEVSAKWEGGGCGGCIVS
jgi:hypothetical protein